MQEKRLSVRKCLPKHAKYNAVGRENERISTERAEKSAQSMLYIMLWAEKNAGKATARAKKSAQSISNIMLWAEKNAGKATASAKMSAQSMLNIMLWAEKTKEYQLSVLKSLPKACQI